MTTSLAETIMLPSRIQPLTDQQMLALTYDLKEARISKKPGGKLSYLESWDIRATLDIIFGIGGWAYELTGQELVRAVEQPQAKDKDKNNWVVTYKTTLRLYVPQLGVFFEESAVGGSQQPDYTESVDMALKTSASDALKRCAINLGTQFGLSLYDGGNTSSVITKSFAPGNIWPRLDPQTEALKQMIAQTPVTDEALAEAARLYPEAAEGVTESQHRANLHLVARGIQHRWNITANAAPAPAETQEEQPAVAQ